MGLIWRPVGPGHWTGSEGGRIIGYVSDEATDRRGATHSWRAWRRKGIRESIVVGWFCSAEEAMAAVDDTLTP